MTVPLTTNEVKDLVNLAHEVIFIYDLENKEIMYQNHDLFFPFDIKAIFEENFVEILHPADQSKFLKFLKNFYIRSNRCELETYLRIKGKNKRWQRLHFKFKISSWDHRFKPRLISASISEIMNEPTQEYIINELSEKISGGFFLATPVIGDDDDIYDLKYEFINEKALENYRKNEFESIGKAFLDLFPGIKKKNLFDKFIITPDRHTLPYVDFALKTEKLDKEWFRVHFIEINNVLLFLFEIITYRKQRNILNQGIDPDFKFESKSADFRDAAIFLLDKSSELTQKVADYNSFIKILDDFVWHYELENDNGYFKFEKEHPDLKIAEDQFFPDIMTGADKSEFLILWEKQKLNPGIFEKRISLKTKSGKNKNFHVKGIPVKISDNSVKWMGFLRDESYSDILLKESELKYRLVSESIPFGGWLCNEEGDLEYISQLFLDLAGMSFEEVKEIGWLQVLYPDNIEEATKKWQKCVQMGYEWEHEHQFKDLKGIYHTILTIGKPFLRQDGNIGGWVGINLDITEQKKSEKILTQKNRQLEAALENLKRVNELLETFVYIASHDLKSPVASLRMLFDITDSIDDDEKKEDLYEKAHEVVRKLEKNLDGIMQILEVIISNGPEADEINLKQVLDEVIDENLELIQNKQASIIFDFDKALSFSYFKPYLVSIFTNLITNSIKYSNPERNPEIKISAKYSCNQVELRVSDNGIGMDLESIRKDMFKPFRRFSHQAEGTGIGLFILKSIIERNGGKLDVESTPGKGTTFICNLKEYINN